MNKQQYAAGLIFKSVVLLVLPQVLFLAFVGYFFPPQGFWAWFVLVPAECAAWIGFLAAIAQLTGSSLSQWLGRDVLQILGSFERTTNRTLNGVRDTLPVLNRRVERNEVGAAWKQVQQGRSVLIEGESGSGKSGIVAEVVRLARRSNMPALFLNARNYASIVSNFGDLQQYVGVNRPVSECLGITAKRLERCLLVIDQLDSVVGLAAFQVSTELLAAVKILKNVRVIAVSARVDSPEYQAIRELGLEIVESGPFEQGQVAHVLDELGIVNASDALKTLSTNLFYLSLVAELSSKTDVGLVTGRVTLLEKYFAALRDVEGAEFVQAAIDIAYENLDAGKVDFALPRIRARAIDRLLGRGLIISVPHGLFRFRHEQLLYYLYAVGAVDKAISTGVILKHIEGHYAVSALVWVLRLYYMRRSDKLSDYLRKTLLKPDRLDFYEQAALIDEVRNWSDFDGIPSATKVILEVLRTKKDLRDYFFRSGPSATWAPVLWEHGFFDPPPAPEKTDQGYMLPNWDIQWYLISVAPQAVDIVLKHVDTIRGDGWYISRAIVALCKIPASESERAVPRIVAWLEEPRVDWSISTEACELMEILIRNDRLDSALQLFRGLTAPQPNADSSRMDLEHVLGTIKQPAYGFQQLVKLKPRETITVLEAQLLKVLDAGTEMAYWRREAIEDTDQDILNTYQDRILSALRDAIETFIATDVDADEQLVRRYLNDQPAILRRIGFYILHSYPSRYRSLVLAELLRRENLDDVEIHHEGFMLLQRGFPLLSPSEQESVVALILEGPDEAKTRALAAWAEENRLADQETYASMHRKGWVRDRLWMIRDYLDEQAKQHLDELIAEGGVPEHPSFLSWSSGMFEINEVSPVTEEVLAEMLPDELVILVKAWQPDPNARFGPERVSRAGLASAVVKVILNDLERYKSFLGAIASTHPVYASFILSRWQNAENKLPIPWNTLLGLCEDLLNTPAAWSNDFDRIEHSGWRDIRLSIAHLIEIGLTDKDRLMPANLLSRARDILIRLVDDADPIPEPNHPSEEQTGYSDPITASLNHVRPVAVRALIRYSAHRTYLVGQNGTGGENADIPSRLEPVVKATLTRKVDRYSDSSVAVHSVFGEYLPELYWLDQEWVKSNINMMFPDDGDEESAWLYMAAWDSFVMNQYPRYLLELLKPYYRRAIRNISKGFVSRSHLHPVQRLAIHIAFEYLLADYDLYSPAGQSSLIVEFFNSTQPEARKDIAWAIWRICEDNQDKSVQFWPRAKAVWEWRTREAIASGHSPNFNEEMEKYAQLSLVAPDRETLVTLRPLLEGLLPHIGSFERRSFGWDSLEKYLAIQVERDPLGAIQFYRLMFDQRASPPRWFHHPPESRKILEVAAANSKSRNDALSLIDMLARRGDYEFKDIYDRYAH